MKPKFEIVLKADSIGSVEAVMNAVSEISVSGVDISIIHSRVGGVNKNDIFLAETASRLIIGFQVDALPGLDKALREHNVELRLYDIIYHLTADIKTISESMILPESKEQIIGSGKVVALFKSTRKGIIVGCEVLNGFLAQGQHFRIISAMGPVYSGTIESLHIGEKAVQKATSGQKIGIKIRDFNKAKIGDIVETFHSSSEKARMWRPTGRIIRK